MPTESGLTPNFDHEELFMSIQVLSPSFAVAPQISIQDLPAIAAAGYKSIICNRPDDEGPGQPSFKDVAEAAARAGLVARHLPVVPSDINEADADAMAQLLRELPGPVLAYCRSGARSTTLWQLSQGR
jgi:sulfide:quinone oxidoreductase